MALVKKLRALSLMGFFHFSVSFALLTSRVSSLLWEFTNSLICNYGSLHLSSKNLEFFWFTQTNLASLIKKPWVFQVHSYCVFRSPEKLKVCWFEKPNSYFVHRKNSRFFLFEMQTAIIAHQWKSKFSQCTANPAGLQRKTDRKMEKPIALRARSFFPWAKLLVLNFVERKNHLCITEKTHK